MLQYQVRGRIFRSLQEGKLDFPNDVSVQFVWAPEPPFGLVAGPSRTLALGSYGQAPPGVDTGRYLWSSDVPFGPLDVGLDMATTSFEMSGHRLTMTGRFETLEDLASRIELIYYRLPLLLNMDFVDSPLVVRVSGRIGRIPFDWILNRLNGVLDVTSKERQEERIRVAFGRLPLLEHRRLLSALHYFRQACRLERAGHAPHDFTAEILLNLAKILEVLFHGDDRDGARLGLRNLGYSDEEIEKQFIPAMLLRSKIDVAHASLTRFSPEERLVLHAYAERAEVHFRELLQRVCDALDKDSLTVSDVTDDEPEREVLQIIETLSQWYSEETPKAGS